MQNKILIIQPWGIGDFIGMIPVFKYLRDNIDNVRIDLYVSKEQSSIVAKKTALVDKIYVNNESSLLSIFQSLLTIKSGDYDYVLNASELGTKWRLLISTVFNKSIVFSDYLNKRPWFFKNLRRFSKTETRTFSNLMLARNLLSKIGIHEKIRAEDYLSFTPLIAAKTELPRIIIHPGSEKNKKFTRVSTEFYKSLIKGILSKINSYIEVIVVIGPDEQDLVDEYSKLTNKDISIYIGVDINETLRLISTASYVVNADSSIGHIASLYGIPTITLAGPTFAERSSSSKSNNFILRDLSNKIGCEPCFYTKNYGNCKYDNLCLERIKIDNIVSYIQLQLKSLNENK
jgi:ADP-heptose:LPS heptosyltransferase